MEEQRSKFGKIDLAGPKFERVLLIALMTIDAGLLIYIFLLWYLLGSLESVLVVPLTFFIFNLLVVVVINIGRFALLLIWNVFKKKKSEDYQFIADDIGT